MRYKTYLSDETRIRTQLTPDSTDTNDTTPASLMDRLELVLKFRVSGNEPKQKAEYLPGKRWKACKPPVSVSIR